MFLAECCLRVTSGPYSMAEMAREWMVRRCRTCDPASSADTRAGITTLLKIKEPASEPPMSSSPLDKARRMSAALMRSGSHASR